MFSGLFEMVGMRDPATFPGCPNSQTMHPQLMKVFQFFMRNNTLLYFW
jgi:hypothetical protein